MGLGVSFRVAPGVRIRASSRGLRTSIGPRGARLHVGGGRPTISSGFGPVTVWEPVGGTRRRRPAARPRPAARSRPATQTRQAPSLAMLQRQADVASAQAAEHALVTLHREEFPPAQRLVVPEPARPDPAQFLPARRSEALHDVPWYAFGRRKQAKRQAAEQAAADAESAWHAARKEQADQQRQADADWADLTSGKPDVVIAALEQAYGDNDSPATCVDAGSDYATVVVVFGTPDLVPDRKPAVTPGGKPTVHKRTKTERNALYVAALGSTALATVKEGFAVAPSVQEIRLLVVRKDPAPPTPDLYLTAIYAARFPRAATQALPWATLDPAETLLRAPGAQLVRRGSAGEIAPLDLRDEPELAALVAELRPHL